MTLVQTLKLKLLQYKGLYPKGFTVTKIREPHVSIFNFSIGRNAARSHIFISHLESNTPTEMIKLQKNNKGTLHILHLPPKSRYSTLRMYN